MNATDKIEKVVSMNIDWLEALSLALMIVPATLFALAVIWLGVRK